MIQLYNFALIVNVMKSEHLRSIQFPLIYSLQYLDLRQIIYLNLLYLYFQYYFNKLVIGNCFTNLINYLSYYFDSAQETCLTRYFMKLY